MLEGRCGIEPVELASSVEGKGGRAELEPGRKGPASANSPGEVAIAVPVALTIEAVDPARSLECGCALDIRIG